MTIKVDFILLAGDLFYSYLELYLQQRRKVDQRNFHALLHPSNLHHIVEVPGEPVIQIEAFVCDIDVEM